MKKYALAMVLAGCATPVIIPNESEPSAEQAASPVHAMRWDGTFACSVVMLDPDVAATAAHCVNPDRVMTVDGVQVTQQDKHPDWDIALIKLASPLDTVTAKPPQKAIEPTEAAWVEGYGCRASGGTEPEFARRRLVFLGMHPTLGLIFQGLACGGDSGGGVFNAQGELIGITVARSTQGPNLAIATPIGFIAEL